MKKISKNNGDTMNRNKHATRKNCSTYLVRIAYNVFTSSNLLFSRRRSFRWIFFLISQNNNLLYLPLFNTAAFTQLLHDISLLRP